MTGKQIKEARDFLDENDYFSLEEKELLQDELKCREMINSDLIYETEDHFYDEKNNKWGEYSSKFLKSLGTKRVLELWKEQKEDIKKAKIIKGLFDSDGLEYYKIIWADDMKGDN